MRIAFTMAPGRGDTDLLLHRLSRRMLGHGYRLAGVVQVNSEPGTAAPCDMDVTVLPDGPVIRISQDLGSGSRGCRLDAAALETAVGLVERSLAGRPDALIVNKFGKHEAEGRGFRPLIAQALEQEIPVLVGLNALNAPAFMEYTCGMAEDLPPSPDVLEAWLRGGVTLRNIA